MLLCSFTDGDLRVFFKVHSMTAVSVRFKGMKYLPPLRGKVSGF